MRVLMCPDFRLANPYQQLLAAAVSRHNISVQWGGYGRFVPPQVHSLSRKPLTIAMEEIAEGKVAVETVEE